MVMNEDNDITPMKRKICETESVKIVSSPLLRTPASSASASPVRSSTLAPVTPQLVEVKYTARTWLETVISPLPSKPSKELEGMLVAVRDRSLVDEVIKRADVVLLALFPARHKIFGDVMNNDSMEKVWSEQRRSEAAKVYYKVLESICRLENKKFMKDLSKVLSNERFHRSLIACSADIVSKACNEFNSLHSIVFERTGITAFDWCKVIERFITSELKLPRELKRYLNSLEEELLEWRLWEKGSTLYNALIFSRLDLSNEIYQLKLLGDPMPSLQTIEYRNSLYPRKLFCSVILRNRDHNKHGNSLKDHDSSAQVSITTQNEFKSLKQSNGQDAYSSSDTSSSSDASIKIIFSKILKVALVRIQMIGERLHQSQQFMEKVYWLFNELLIKKTTLFFEQRMYQIIPYCFFIIAKSSRIDMDLEQVLRTYLKLPQCNSQVFCSTFGKKRINELKKVYSEIFVPNAKSFLENIAKAGTQISEMKNDDGFPNSPSVTSIPRVPDMSPRKVFRSHNVYLSPMPLSKDCFNSNIASSYAILGEKIHPYESPSKQLTVINERLNGPGNVRRRLNFISDEVAFQEFFEKNSNC